MKKQSISYLLSLTLLGTSISAFAGSEHIPLSALEHRDSYVVQKYDANHFRFKKVSDFGDFLVTKDQDYTLTNSEVPEYTKYLNKPITVGQYTNKIPTDKSLALISNKLDRSKLSKVNLIVQSSQQYLDIGYTFNDPLARLKLKDKGKFEYVDYRDSKGKAVMQHVYGVDMVKSAVESVLASGIQPFHESFLKLTNTDTTQFINAVQMKLDSQYPDIFKIETIGN